MFCTDRAGLLYFLLHAPLLWMVGGFVVCFLFLAALVVVNARSASNADQESVS